MSQPVDIELDLRVTARKMIIEMILYVPNVLESLAIAFVENDHRNDRGHVPSKRI